MKKFNFTALFLVSILLGVMVGLEFHIDRSSSARAYTSYLAATDNLTTALNNTQRLNNVLANVKSEYDALAKVTNIHAHGLRDLKKELKSLENQAGVTPSVGEGIAITINYDPNLPLIPGLRYVDEAEQLQIIVNYMQAAGANGIAINGQRLITTSSIRTVNGLSTQTGPFSGVVQVNAEPIAAPYVIEVIGSISTILNLINAEGLKDQFAILDQSFQIHVYRSPHLLHLPAYAGVLPGQYSTEVGM